MSTAFFVFRPFQAAYREAAYSYVLKVHNICFKDAFGLQIGTTDLGSARPYDPAHIKLNTMAQNSFISSRRDANNPEKLYRLRTEWSDRSCNITIFVESVTHAYFGQITEDQVKTMSKALKYTEEEYVEECRNSLHPDQNDGLFSYQMDGDSFIIKKQVPDKKSMKQILSKIKLEKTDFYKSFFEMFDGTMRQITNMNAKSRDLEIENENIKRVCDAANQRLKEMAHLKVKCEELAYTRFLCFLNAQKLNYRQPTGGEDKLEESTKMDFVTSDDYAYNAETDDMGAVSDKPSPSVAVCDEPSHSEAAYGQKSPEKLCVSKLELETNLEPIFRVEKGVIDEKSSKSPQSNESISGEKQTESTNWQNDPPSICKRSEIETYGSDDDALFDLTVRRKEYS